MSQFGYKWNIPENKYFWTDEMDEISGFGENYEECCRFMLTRSLEFFDRRKAKGEFDPHFEGIQGFMGLIDDTNQDAKELKTYILNAVYDYFGEEWEPSTAQFQAIISHTFWIRRNGWEKFREDMIKRKQESPPKKKKESRKGKEFGFFCLNCGKDIKYISTGDAEKDMNMLYGHSENCEDRTTDMTVEEKAHMIVDEIDKVLKDEK